ncbi:MAG TPA: 2-amino-4-hydroxy-6-hydroxymethyldihydropteridine diphosphokinase [Paludibacteraceae bacterium]|nr:2-amino-4-hydroxy-6-hydroxymethyldihydropteridine diphosphokinase [Paludibacteraceae bacterium]HOL00067.1 2-amino-4-hydroxy-6-hydroxymethyldihydropteridine diphosphokinase [Paludibacteraceae bacterium]HOO19037.1 2-amino-4-hydroxy-6-hydroxymethyldihydropteridine diphosphokinase [Paludibacteraceae bacterium]HPO66994.1 2-amino-4-hydroxy-6-hydroxymethyldihydropteridine diphosphokinase [Paludibacteraceae bacterium]
MNTAIVMLGSNFNADENIDLAKEKLAEYFEIASFSSRIVTDPEGDYPYKFYNEAVKLFSDETAKETINILKQIEKELGRTPESKQTKLIPIDIDLIFWNETLIKDDYYRYSFVKKCIDEIK